MGCWVDERSIQYGAATDQTNFKLCKHSLHLYVIFALLVLPRIPKSVLVAGRLVPAHLSVSIASTLIIPLKHSIFFKVEPVVHQVMVPWQWRPCFFEDRIHLSYRLLVLLFKLRIEQVNYFL